MTDARDALPQPALKYVRSRNPSFSLRTFPRPVVFTHIPKAAGTTLDRILNAITFYQQSRWLRVSGTIYGQVFGSEKTDALDNFRRLSDRQLADVDVLTGHLPYGAHERLGRDCFKVTLLREPVERCLSHYRFGLTRGGWGAVHRVGDLFASGAMKDNSQVRQIAGLSDPTEPCAAEHLRRAKDHLANGYDLVGTAERFDEFLRELLTRLALPHVVYTDYQVNELRVDAAVEDGLRETFAEFNTYDAELYAFARQLVEDRFPGAATPPITGPAQGEDVLLVSRHLKLGNYDHALLPAAIFEQQALELERRQGVRVVRHA